MRATDTGISWPASEPDSTDRAPPGGPMVGSCANWGCSTIYTILLRKPGLLQQTLLHATSSDFVLTFVDSQKMLPSTSILNTKIFCT